MEGGEIVDVGGVAGFFEFDDADVFEGEEEDVAVFVVVGVVEVFEVFFPEFDAGGVGLVGAFEEVDGAVPADEAFEPVPGLVMCLVEFGQ